MTTMLEKMARAMALRDGEDPEMGTWDVGANRAGPKVWETYVPKARAALQAIREPDAVMLQGGEDAMEGYMDDDLEPVFTAMIDAILNEKPGGTT